MAYSSPRTMAAYKYKEVVSEEEWTRARKALEFLDLADHNEKLSTFYKEEFLSGDDEAFQSHWIATSGEGFPVDDCRVLHDWFKGESGSYSVFHHQSMKDREPDWIGRNIFLEYVEQKLVPDLRYLESGEPSVRFMDLARLCGFESWKESDIDEEWCVSDHIFSRVYPSVLIGLHNVRELYPRKAAELWEMFCFTYDNLYLLFEKMPDGQHLLLLLNLARDAGTNLWDIRTGVDNFSFDRVVNEYIIQDRYDLIRLLLSYGLTLEVEPLHWLQSIYKDLWESDCDFTATVEFKQVLRSFFMEHFYPYPPPRIVKDALRSFYRSMRQDPDKQLDTERGTAILLELVEAYKTCGINC